ncbi:PLD nuclease N-terminal domain-containing protein [Austwickia chelonae]|uniref:PLD nuclease N-terminal domain-containing protein n=1 Tax=Austwickia chelonae TaxID=100225 RepID=UPI000E25A46B|nr:PLD nuclease N-terminal domain-containing protein [Austwickia chelonae]
MLRVVLMLALLAFTVYAVSDCIQTDEERLSGLPKATWVMVVLAFPGVGATVWFLVGRPYGPNNSSLVKRLKEPPRPRGPRGPDDDPDFLKSL